MQIKESIKRLILIIIVFALLVFATVAWFVSQKEVDGTIDSLNVVDINEVGATMYQKINGEWKPITILKFENMVPGEKLEYKIIVTSRSKDVKTVALQLSEITEDKKNNPIKMMTKLMIDGISINPPGSGNPSPHGALSDLVTDGNLVVMNAINFSPNEEKEIYFNIILNGDATNEYQDKTVNVKSVDLDYK